MAKTILVTGGFASGKSRWVIKYFNACDYVLYLCPEEEMDADTLNRIKYGNEKNYVEWDIQTDVADSPHTYISDHKFAVLDSLAAYTKRVMDTMCPAPEEVTEEAIKSIAKKVIDDVVAMYDAIKENDGTMTIITLETGFSMAPEDKRQAAYGKILGMINQRIANISTEVYLLVSGIPMRVR